MTKKDYELIEKAISEAKDLVREFIDVSQDKKDLAIAGICQAEYTLSLKLKKENPRFDIDKFREACK